MVMVCFSKDEGEGNGIFRLSRSALLDAFHLRGERRQRQNVFKSSAFLLEETLDGKEIDESRRNADLPFFDLNTIVVATNNFSSDNKLGRGGFGSVYKGVLLNGKEIAVKRLSRNSGQGEEKMLIYEYLPNKSLDSIIFDESKRSSLDWKKRFEIICGIARGILYLHQDSKLRIIHRDLKASNVLLDAAMNPKISDFGMARIFGGDQIEGSTNRVVGTYGYMSPEYAMEGLFSVKSDVYSFGVLLLEIVTGRKNSGYYPDSPSLNLVGHIWNLWNEDKAMEVIDSALALPFPKRPAFILKKDSDGKEIWSSERTCSTNNVTITTVQAH
ncbi:hypothetical protein PTKIN_Ptkin16aG0045800 [Pterospermum kingtungense]